MRRDSLRTALRFVLVTILGLFSNPVLQAQTKDIQTLTRILDLYRLSMCTDAIPVMRPFVNANPNNIEVRLLLADCLARTEDWNAAASQYQAILTLAPAHVDASKGLRRATAGRQSKAATEEQIRVDDITFALDLQKSQSFIQRKDLAGAQAILETIIAAQPLNTVARQRLADVYSSTRQFEKAVAQYRVLQGETTLRLEATRQIAKNLEWAGRFAEAADAYRQFLQERSGDLEARLGLANVLIWSAQYADAAIEYEKLQEAGASSTQIQLALAECYEHLSRAESALQTYESILRSTPGQPIALQGRDKIRQQMDRIRQEMDELPRLEGYRQLEAGDLEASLHSFETYLHSHPAHDETLIQIARLQSWMQRYPEAIAAYRQYLKNNSDDITAKRELGHVLVWMQEYSEAVQKFEELVSGASAVPEDYEQLVQINIWMGNISAAGLYAGNLLQLDPNNVIAAHALDLHRKEAARLEHDAAEALRLTDRNAADMLAATGRFREAAEAYKKYMSNYGHDRTIELTIARLFGWAADYDEARKLYSAYLNEYPDDLQARYELGTVESWSGDLANAKAEYRAVLSKDSENVAARMALAQASDYAGDDRVVVLDQFKDVLAIDPANVEAKTKAGRIRLEVAPMAAYSFLRISDSDGLDRNSQALATTFTFRGGARFTPNIVYSEFKQNRILPFATEGAEEINARIEKISGKTYGRGGYLDIRVDRSQWSFGARGGAFRYGRARYMPHAEVNLEYHPAHVARVQFNVRRSEASSDLNTISAVVSGMIGTSGELLYQQQFGNRVAFTASAGMTEYSSQEHVSQSESLLRRGMARLDFRLSRNLSIGYIGRLNRYDRQSSLYFSPRLYEVNGVAYRLTAPISQSFSLTVDGEVAQSRLPAANTIETAITSRFVWRLQPSLELRSLYRWGRSSRSGFGSTIYRMDGFELNLSKVF